MRFNRPQSSRLLSHPPKSSCLTSRTTCEFSFVLFSVSARCLTGRTYSCVNFDGTPVERGDKHPFCMARVHYNETDEKVWFQASDQSHRWQQSASEIRIMVSNLPVKAKEIDVFISIESLKISNVATGQIFFGRLSPAPHHHWGIRLGSRWRWRYSHHLFAENEYRAFRKASRSQCLGLDKFIPRQLQNNVWRLREKLSRLARASYEALPYQRGKRTGV